MDFSLYLKSVIAKMGYSYRKLGELSGVNHTYISKICRGTTGSPSPEILMKLAVPLCVPYEELLKKAGYLLAEDEKKYHNIIDNEIILRIAKLTPEGKEKLTEYLDFLEDREKMKRRRKRMNQGSGSRGPE